ncbi:MAG: hypothetical protein ACP5QP_01280 [Brevinematia bacterium]
MPYDFNLLRSFLSLVFKDRIQNLKIVSTFDLTNIREILIIKLDKPIDEGIIVVYKNFENPDEIIKLNFISLMIGENLKGRIFKKKVDSRLISGEELILIEFSNYFILIQSIFIKKLIFLTSKKIYIPILLPIVPISGERLLSTMESIKNKIRSKNYFDILDDAKFLLNNNNGNITELGVLSFDSPEEISIKQEEFHKIMIQLLCVFSSIPWDFDEMFDRLDDIQMQYILSYLRKRVIPEEILFLITMCPRNFPKILRNISKRTLEEVLEERITTHIPYYLEWNRYVLQKKVSRLFELVKDIDVFNNFVMLKESIGKIFSTLYVRDDLIINVFKYLEDKGIADQFISRLGIVNLAKVIKNLGDSDIEMIIGILKKYMSKNGLELFFKDLEYFKSDSRDNFDAKLIFFDTLLDFYFTKDFLQGKLSIITMADEIDDLKVHYASNITSLGSFYLTLSNYDLSYVKSKVLNKLFPRSAIKKYIESALEGKFIIEFGEGMTNDERVYSFTKALFLINRLEKLRNSDDFVIY